MSGLTLSQIRAGILKATGTSVDDWDNGNTDLDQYANVSWWDIADKFDFRENEAPLTTFPTVVGTRSYDLVDILDDEDIDFNAIQRVSIEDLNDFKHTDLIVMSDFDYENEFVNTDDNYNKPTRYFRRDNLLYLFETPDDTYTITLYALQNLSDIPTEGPVVPRAWHEIIKAGANWRACMDLGDAERMTFWMGIQKDLIEGRTPVKAKELSDTKLAGIEVPGRDYP